LTGFIKQLEKQYSAETEQAMYDYLLELTLPQQQLVPRKKQVKQLI
jgi:hypothetical protein